MTQTERDVERLVLILVGLMTACAFHVPEPETLPAAAVSTGPVVFEPSTCCPDLGDYRLTLEWKGEVVVVELDGVVCGGSEAFLERGEDGVYRPATKLVW
jgi:hypothetical protein